MSRNLLTIALSTILMGSAFSAPVPSVENTSTIAKARKALEQKITTKVDAKPLSEVVQILNAQAGTELIIDSTLGIYGIDPGQTNLTFDVKDTSLKDVLDKALSPHNLRYGLTSYGIVISSDDAVTIRQMRQRIAVNADKQSVSDVVAKLAEDTGVSVVIDPKITAKFNDEKITLKLKNTPVETAIRLSVEMSGYSVVRMSNVLYITSESRAEKLRHDSDKPAPPQGFSPAPFDALIGPNGPGAVPVPIAPQAPGAAPAPANPKD